MNKLLLSLTLAALAWTARADTTNVTLLVVVDVTDSKGAVTSTDQTAITLSPTAVNGFLVVMGKDEMLAQQQTNKPPTFLDSVAGEVKASIAPHLEAIAISDEQKRTKIDTLPATYAKFSDADKQAVAAIVAKYAP